MRFRSSIALILTGLLLFTAASSAVAAPVTIKLGTLAPVGSSYHKLLQAMGENWKRDSKGSVELRIYAGGKAGGEAEMVGLIMENSLQASMLTAVGLAEIDISARGLQSLPMAFHSLEEVDYVGERLQPMLEQILLEKGFVVLFWSDVGWVRFFSKSRIRTPDDLRKLRLFSWSGDNEQMAIVKSAGFNLVPIETADIVPSLSTGLIDAVPMPPFFALASQVDRRAPFMMDLNYAPLVGACVVSRKVWETIPSETRASLLALSRAVGRDMKMAGRRENGEAEAAMVKRGLEVVQLTQAERELWRTMAEPLYPQIRGRMIPAPVFDRAMEALLEYRSRNAK